MDEGEAGDEGGSGLGGGGVGGGCCRGGVLGQTTFTDVPKEHPQRVDIEYAVAQNWFLGYTDGTFKPDRIITAEQITTVIQRAFPDGATRGDMAVFMRAGNQALRTAVITEGDDVAIAWGTVQNRWTARGDDNPIYSAHQYNFDRDGYRYLNIPLVLPAMEDMADAWAVTAVLVEKKGTAAAAAAAEAARAASVAAADGFGTLGALTDINRTPYRADNGTDGEQKVRKAFRASSSAALAMAEVAVDAEEVKDWQYISRKWTEATEASLAADSRAAEAAARTQSVFASYW